MQLTEVDTIVHVVSLGAGLVKLTILELQGRCHRNSDQGVCILTKRAKENVGLWSGHCYAIGTEVDLHLPKAQR